MSVAVVNVIGLGANTPIGRSIWASAAAARAGVSGFSEHPFIVDSVGEPMRVARAPWIDANEDGSQRFCDLLLPALEEALRPVRARPTGEYRIGLALALPLERPGRPRDLPRAVSEAVSERFGSLFARTVTFDRGHAAGHVAFDTAVRSLSATSIDACLVAGVDSYLAADTLEWLEDREQVHGTGPLNNAWGFIPGEAAGAMLLATNACVEALDAEVFGEVVSVGIGHETNLIKTDTVCVGEGLTHAFRSSLAALTSSERIDNVFCDLNGETYRADEYGFAVLRVKERFRAATDFVAPADCWGDVGAAGAPLHAALGLVAHHKNYSKGRLSMVCASSESGERGAMVVRGMTAPSG